ncbi:hypothetical protein FPOAC2_04737 [Fusarium poae]
MRPPLQALALVFEDFKTHRRAMLGDANLKSRLRNAAKTTSETLSALKSRN